MAWRPMRSLAVLDDPRAGLRGQVNALAPGRSKASDGLIGDAAHASTSGHYPHTVPGVGTEIVTAWDCTSDPRGGCDSRLLAETLRRHRDPRIRYVISEREIFSSYASGSRPAWTWGPYSGVDPHENHAHIQVLDAPISDTSTPWNLQGFIESEDDVTPAQEYLIRVQNARMFSTVRMRSVTTMDAFVTSAGTFPAINEPNDLVIAINEIKADIAALPAGGSGGGGDAAVLSAVADVEKRVDALISGIRANADAVDEFGTTP